jgi:translation machinery-associated protein 16
MLTEDSYVHQYDEELNGLRKARRPGRPTTAREDLLKVAVATLEKEYENGFRE